VRGAVQVIIAYGHFNWNERDDGFVIDKQANARFKAWSTQMVTSGRLLRGFWKSKTWIGFTTVSRLLRTFLERAVHRGTPNWDVVLAKCLSIVLVSALGVRSGDLARSYGYRGDEYLQYRHIELYLDSPEPLFTNLRAKITVEFAKGHKSTRNVEQIYYLSPLVENHQRHVCPITFLLVHALRHSLVEGATLEDILQTAAQRSDRTVRWLFPNRPVLVAFTSRPLRCVLDQPASYTQLWWTIREMGLIAGMLDRCYAHALRKGAARDLAHLPGSAFDGKGVTTEIVRQSIGHNATTLSKGVTEAYVGGMSADAFSARAANLVSHRREPAFAAVDAVQPHDIVWAPVTIQELKQAQVNHGRTVGRKAAMSRVRSERTRTLDTTVIRAPRGDLGSLTAPSPVPVPTLVSSDQRMPLASKDPNAASMVSSSTKLLTRPSADATPSDNIDPALLDDEQLMQLAHQVSDAAVESLQALLSQRHSTDAQNAEVDTGSLFVRDDDTDLSLEPQDEANIQSSMSAEEDAQATEDANAILGPDPESQTDVVASTATAEHWIKVYASYNIVECVAFSRLWLQHCTNPAQRPQGQDFDDIFGHLVVSGGSRAHPQPLVHRCTTTPGCPYTSVDGIDVAGHSRYCNPEKVEALQDAVASSTRDDAEDFSCPYQGCQFRASPAAKNRKKCLKQHISSVHSFAAKACEHGCEPAKLYVTEKSYRYHQQTAHTEGWPAKCEHSDCGGGRSFETAPGFLKHLQRDHGLTQEEAHQYMPARVKSTWVPQTCFMDGCSKWLETRKKQVQHLVSSCHGLEQKSAQAAVAKRAEFRAIVPERQQRSTPALHAAIIQRAIDGGGNSARTSSKRAKLI